MTSQRVNLRNYGIGWHIQKNKMKKPPSQKSARFLMQIVEEIYVLLFMLRCLQTSPSKIGLDRKSYNPRQQQADIWQDNFFILSFPNVPTHPIISQH